MDKIGKIGLILVLALAIAIACMVNAQIRVIQPLPSNIATPIVVTWNIPNGFRYNLTFIYNVLFIPPMNTKISYRTGMPNIAPIYSPEQGIYEIELYSRKVNITYIPSITITNISSTGIFNTSLIWKLDGKYIKYMIDSPNKTILLVFKVRQPYLSKTEKTWLIIAVGGSSIGYACNLSMTYPEKTFLRTINLTNTREIYWIHVPALNYTGKINMTMICYNYTNVKYPYYVNIDYVALIDTYNESGYLNEGILEYLLYLPSYIMRLINYTANITVGGSIKYQICVKVMLSNRTIKEYCGNRARINSPVFTSYIWVIINATTWSRGSLSINGVWFTFMKNMTMNVPCDIYDGSRWIYCGMMFGINTTWIRTYGHIWYPENINTTIRMAKGEKKCWEPVEGTIECYIKDLMGVPNIAGKIYNIYNNTIIYIDGREVRFNTTYTVANMSHICLINRWFRLFNPRIVIAEYINKTWKVVTNRTLIIHRPEICFIVRRPTILTVYYRDLRNVVLGYLATGLKTVIPNMTIITPICHGTIYAECCGRAIKLKCLKIIRLANLTAGNWTIKIHFIHVPICIAKARIDAFHMNVTVIPRCNIHRIVTYKGERTILANATVNITLIPLVKIYPYAKTLVLANSTNYTLIINGTLPPKIGIIEGKCKLLLKNKTIAEVYCRSNRTIIEDLYNLTIIIRDALGRIIKILHIWKCPGTNITLQKTVHAGVLKLGLPLANKTSIVIMKPNNMTIIAIYKVSLIFKNVKTRTVNGKVVINGTVVDYNATPIPNIEIRAVEYCNNRQIINTTRTDKHGNFMLTMPSCNRTIILETAGNSTIFENSNMKIKINISQKKTPIIIITGIATLTIIAIILILLAHKTSIITQKRRKMFKQT